MDFLQWFKRKKDSAISKAEDISDIVKEKYNDLAAKASEAKDEDALANAFTVDDFAKRVISRNVMFLPPSVKHIRTLMEDYDMEEIRSVHGYFCLKIKTDRSGKYISFFINNARQRFTDIHRLYNLVKKGIDSSEAENGVKEDTTY